MWPRRSVATTSFDLALPQVETRGGAPPPSSSPIALWLLVPALISMSLNYLIFFQEWTSSQSLLPDRMLQLWSDLYKAGFLPDSKDVQICKLWIDFLKEKHHPFPATKRHRYHNVVVMGQFNYGHIPVPSVILWAQKWREHFRHVVVRGCFEAHEIAEINAHGILAHPGRIDDGLFSPIENLMLTLQHYEHDPRIGGVMYFHDDRLFNLTAIDHGTGVFPTQHILKSHIAERAHAERIFPNPRAEEELTAPWAYKIYKDGTFMNLYLETFNTSEALLESEALAWWSWREKYCLPGQIRMAKDPRSDPYRDNDGGLYFPPFGQYDFLFVPTRFTSPFADIAKLHMEDPPVFLECSFALAVEVLRRYHNATFHGAKNLCSDHETDKRNTPIMIRECMQHPTIHYDFFHPFQLSNGNASWSAIFDFIVHPRK